MLSLRQRLKLIVVSVGCFVCYTILGILVESIFKGDYRDGQIKENFKFPSTFVWLQCTFYLLFAKGKVPLNLNRAILALSNQFTRAVILLTRDHARNETGQAYFATMAVFHSLGHVMTNMALQYISYPTQVVGKGT
jgi:UAA transporter family